MGYERNTGRYYRDNEARPSGYDRDDRGRDYRDRDHRETSYRRPRDYDDDRGFLDRAGDEVRSWFGDEEAERRRRWDERIRQREYERAYGREGDPHAGGASSYGYGVGMPGMPGMPGMGVDGGFYGRYGGAGPGDAYGVGRGAGASHDDWGQDPNYRSWRRRQLDALDRDYADYRRENQSRFEQDFGSWRDTRQGQRQLLDKVQEHQEVVGADGVHIGTVDHVRDDRILLTKTDKSAGGRHHSIPCAWIVEVDDKVHISRTATQAQSVWKDEETGQGPHYLDRAFSGTY